MIKTREKDTEREKKRERDSDRKRQIDRSLQRERNREKQTETVSDKNATKRHEKLNEMKSGKLPKKQTYSHRQLCCSGRF